MQRIYDLEITVWGSELAAVGSEESHWSRSKRACCHLTEWHSSHLNLRHKWMCLCILIKQHACVLYDSVAKMRIKHQSSLKETLHEGPAPTEVGGRGTYLKLHVSPPVPSGGYMPAAQYERGVRPIRLLQEANIRWVYYVIKHNIYAMYEILCGYLTFLYALQIRHTSFRPIPVCMKAHVRA